MEPRLLIVEDDPLSLWAMQDYFRARGLGVAAASDRAAAERALAAHRYALVITDLRLGPAPNVDGLLVVSAARAGQPGTPVILLTASGAPEAVAEAYRRGADRVLCKPHPLPALARIATDLIERARTT